MPSLLVLSSSAILVQQPQHPLKLPNLLKKSPKPPPAATDAAKSLSPENMKNLKDATEAVANLYEATEKIAEMMETLSEDIDTDMPEVPDSNLGTKDQGRDGILTLGAWDQWTLEADDSMDFAVSREIGGAAEYRLELWKHAIDGKVAAQTRLQTIKAGQEYAQVALRLTERDVQRLTTLRATFQTDINAVEEAKAMFYDRMIMIRTSVLIELQKAIWAYKYYSLETSKVVLDPLKSNADLKADAQLIVQELTNWKEVRSSDPSRSGALHSCHSIPMLIFNLAFTPPPMLASKVSLQFPSFHSVMMPNKRQLGLSYGPQFIQSLKSVGKATFTLTPDIPGSSDMLALKISGPFTGGSHFRVFGLRAYLVGAKPKPTNTDGSVTLTISTSGIYNDIQDSQVFTFTMLPLSRRFQYSPMQGTAPSGQDGFGKILADSIIQSHDYVDPTPFAQWTIMLKNVDQVDLSGLTDITLIWQGNAIFSS